ncbi:MAG TPA: cupin domain-containing protein [Flavipsychrobacter sp.]
MAMEYNAQYWKDKLNLESHVEGGSFREIYRSQHVLPKEVLKPAHKGSRSVSTSIYFLLEYGQFSAFHRIASDEVWHFYDGSSLCVYEIRIDGQMVKHLLGKNIDSGENPQVIIQAGSWFGSRVEEEGGYTLCGCTVAPGFDFQDFELAEREQLIQQYPQHSAIIKELT